MDALDEYFNYQQENNHNYSIINNNLKIDNNVNQLNIHDSIINDYSDVNVKEESNYQALHRKSRTSMNKNKFVYFKSKDDKSDKTEEKFSVDSM